MSYQQKWVNSNLAFHPETEKPQEYEEKEMHERTKEATVKIQVGHLLRWWSTATSLNRSQLCQFEFLESLYPTRENIQSGLD